MMKINKKSKEGIRKKIALISLAALLLNTAMVGMFAPLGNTLRAENEQMCEAAIDVVLVMDRSGSMAWDIPSRLSQAKIAANSFLGNLGTNDQSALVSYASTASLDKGLSDNHTTDPSSTEAAVNALVAVGGTNIGDAIAEGTAEFSSGRENDQAVKVMILLTDGRATCPVIHPGYPTCGYIEDQGDIDYAEAKAMEAASEEIKIFTIGLGSDVNETMLQNIAAMTNADYYFAPDGSALEDIYESIRWQLCEYGSISGCKYSDINNDNDISGENTITDWPIILSGHSSDSQNTDGNGCYSFTGLLPGTYTVNEGPKPGEIFEQTYPLLPNFYTIGLTEGENAVNKDFGNYLPYCGNDIVDTGYSGYTDEVCDGDEPRACETLEGYAGLQVCDSCLWGGCIPQEWCGDGIINNGEECDDGKQCEDGITDCTDNSLVCLGIGNGTCETRSNDSCSANCTIESYCGDGIVDPGEECEIGDSRECDASGYVGSQSCNQDCLGWGVCETDKYCGDGIIDNPEYCDDGLLLNGTYGYCNDECTGNTPSVCGNGDIEGDETCDDGNTDDGDGCSSTCQIESPINPGDIIINELMWMGSANSGYDEWIELKNTTQLPIEDLDGCYLNRMKGGIEELMLDIPSGASIGVNGYYLISNYDHDNVNSNIDVVPDLVDTDVSLLNGELQITLYCGETLIDTAGDGYAPLAGSNDDPKKSMQWCGSTWEDALVGGVVNNWDIDTTEFGTPGLPNVCEEEPDLGSLTICKQEDLNGNGNLDNEEPVVTDPLWKFYIDETEYQAEGNGCITIDEMPYGVYNVVEEIISGWEQTGASGNGTLEGDNSITVTVGQSNPVPIIYFLNQREQPAPYCGDGTCDTNIGENCSTCPADCGSCGGGGGGGGVITKPTIIITDEKVVYLGGGEALVTWTTNIETTRQVAYGDDSITVLGGVPEYGYDSVNEESTGMTKDHSVTVGGLVDGVVYYFRPIADRSGSTGEKTGIEVTYELGEVKGIVDPIVPEECNYLLEYIKLGADNNPVEVKKLETFLNIFEGENLAVNGIYEQVDFDAVSRFQEKYLGDVLAPWSHNAATGYVYITTKKKINELYCEREFPLTPEQEAEVSAFSARFLSTPVEGDEWPDVVGDSEVPTEEDTEEGKVEGAETEEETGEETGEEELTGLEEEGIDYSQEIKIELEDEDEGDDTAVASSNYSRYALIILALIILALSYYFYNSRKGQKEDTQ